MSENQDNGKKTINNLNKQEIPLTTEESEKLIKEIFHDSSDLEIQSFKTSKGMALVAYIDGLSNKDLVDRDIISPLKMDYFNGDLSLTLKAVYNEIPDIPTAIDEILKGNTIVLFNRTAISVDFKQWDKRSVETPDVEAVTRGPREGFNENFRTNTALIRRKIKSPDLIFETMYIGKQTRTAVAIVYIKGIVNKLVLKNVREKLEKINTDSILETGYLEQFIDKNPFSPVSGIGLTQKPDIAAGRILEGRVGILCDGTPHMLTIPELFIENIHTAEDYYNRVILTTFLRILRVMALFISVMLPGIAIAVMTFNHEMMPHVFLVNLISAMEKTPLPAGAEIFLLMVMFELLRESGTRLPRTIGSAISIVGALIIGEAAVNAGIVSAPTVIIVALTAVSSFILPNLSEFIVLYRFLFIFLGSTMGLIGIGSGIMLLVSQLSSVESFGVPILASFSKNDFMDSVIKMPVRFLKYRPYSIAKDNIVRVGQDKEKNQ